MPSSHGCRLTVIPLIAALSACQNVPDVRGGLLQEGPLIEPIKEEEAPARVDAFHLRDDSDVVGLLQEAAARHEDTLFDIARRYDLGFREIRAANPGVDVWLPKEGTRVVIPSRFILPDAPREGIVLNLAAFRLFYFPPPGIDGSRIVITHPIGIGREGWTTPLGLTRVASKVASPTWIPPPSIRREHAAAGDPLPASVPPGPANPLGAYAMRLARPKYLIHGTNKPDGIGMRVSHGCIQMFPEDIKMLFRQVPVGTPVRIVNQPYLAGWQDGVLYLSARKPLEEQAKAWNGSLQPMIKAVEKAAQTPDMPIDWAKAETLARAGHGFPMPISQHSPDMAEENLAASDVQTAPPAPAPVVEELPEAAPPDPTPAVQEPAEPAPALAEMERPWYIQTGSFKIERNAQQLIVRLQQLGPPIPAQPIKSGSFHRVLAGPFANQSEAQENARRIQSGLGADVIVLPPGRI
jgi:L,D-transpeptidase ErfK/SrfK